jgi:hypothetical protein
MRHTGIGGFLPFGEKHRRLMSVDFGIGPDGVSYTVSLSTSGGTTGQLNLQSTDTALSLPSLQQPSMRRLQP